MGMELSKDIGKGIIATYHRIARVDRDYDSKQTRVHVVGYVSKDVRDGDVKAGFPGTDYLLEGIPEAGKTDGEWAYPQIKARPEWSGAKDV